MCEEIQRQGLYIQLQNYSRPYQPGETIIGELYVVIKKPQEFKCTLSTSNHFDLIL